jgi:hypothetical protein
MKLVKEILYENIMKFTEKPTDPIKDMGIGGKTIIEKWLKDLGITEYRFTRKNEINVYNSVFITNRKINEIPDYVKFNHIMGGFHISSNDLYSLKGCPYSVSGSFGVGNNKLYTLKFGPKIVKESYGASYNNLESLEGIAKIIGISIIINHNNLKSLEFIPEIIHGDLYIQNNPIQTLKYFPKEIHGDLYYTPSKYLVKEEILKICQVRNLKEL